MTTPIIDFVQRYRESGALRAHMPGHKGISSLLGCEALDITEIDGADVLYHAKGIIRESEENATALFGSGATFYSAEGSSLSIRAMLYLVSLYAAKNGKKAKILAARNAHKVFLSAAALLDLAVDWLYPETDSLLACPVTAEHLEQTLANLDESPVAVYITSPDYLGNMADLAALAQVCHRHGVLFLVDNAHGAYLNFLPKSLHPIVLGADMCCDSAHKTLPALTGAAYLHISKSAPALFAENAERALALFASTSPSYLILQSLDYVNQYIANTYAEKLAIAIEKWSALKSMLTAKGFLLAGNEPLKLTILSKAYGYTGEDMAGYLQAHNIFVEYADADHCVLMLSPEWSDAEIQQIESALLSLPQKAPVLEMPPALPHPQQAMTPHAALFADTEVIAAENSCGRIMADATVSCPPAIPIVVSGERIDETAVRAFAYYGIESVTVVKEYGHALH